MSNQSKERNLGGVGAVYVSQGYWGRLVSIYCFDCVIPGISARDKANLITIDNG